MIEKIKRVANRLYQELDEVYCDTCRHNCSNDGGYCESACEECHRRAMNWQISQQAAWNIAEKIVNDDMAD